MASNEGAGPSLSFDPSELPDQPKPLTFDPANLPDQPKPLSFNPSELPDQPIGPLENWEEPNQFMQAAPSGPEDRLTDDRMDMMRNAKSEEDFTAAGYDLPPNWMDSKPWKVNNSTEAQNILAVADEIKRQTGEDVHPSVIAENLPAFYSIMGQRPQPDAVDLLLGTPFLPSVWAGGISDALLPGSGKYVQAATALGQTFFMGGLNIFGGSQRYWQLLKQEADLARVARVQTYFKALEMPDSMALLRQAAQEGTLSNNAFNFVGGLRAAGGLALYHAQGEALDIILSYAQDRPHELLSSATLADLLPKDIDERGRLVAKVLDVFAKGMGVHAGFKGMEAAWQNAAYVTVSNLMPSRTFYIRPENAAEMTPEIMNWLGIDKEQRDLALRYGVDLETPAFNVISKMDSPLFAKVKDWLRISPYGEVLSAERISEFRGRPHVAGLIEPPVTVETPPVSMAPEAPGGISPPGEGLPTPRPQEAKIGALPAVSARQSEAMQFFQEKGWSPEQAAGIVGNLAHESGGLNPTIEGDGGASYGLAQWNGDRRQGLMAYAASKGEQVPSFRTQLEYVQRELETSEAVAAAALKRTGSIQEATRVFSEQFERPGVPLMSSRMALADAAYNGKAIPSMTRSAFVEAVREVPEMTVEQKQTLIDMADAGLSPGAARTRGRSMTGMGMK